MLEVTMGTELVEGEAGKLTPFRLVIVQELPRVQFTPPTVVTPLPGRSPVEMARKLGAPELPLGAA